MVDCNLTWVALTLWVINYDSSSHCRNSVSQTDSVKSHVKTDNRQFWVGKNRIQSYDYKFMFSCVWLIRIHRLHVVENCLPRLGHHISFKTGYFSCNLYLWWLYILTINIELHIVFYFVLPTVENCYYRMRHSIKIRVIRQVWTAGWMTLIAIGWQLSFFLGSLRNFFLEKVQNK